MEDGRTIMLRHYTLQPGTADAFIDWWKASIVPLREAWGFAIDWAYLDRENNTFTWTISYPGDEAAFRACDEEYSAHPDRAAALSIAPPLAGATFGFPERIH